MAPFFTQTTPGPKNSFSGSSWTILHKSFGIFEKSQFWGSGGPPKVKTHPKNYCFPLIFPYRFIKELPHEAEKSYLTFLYIKKKLCGKMAVTFLKLNIFWFSFFLIISTYPETFKNKVYLPKTNFWGSLPPIQNKNMFSENPKNTKFSKIISDRFLYVSGLPCSFSGFRITSMFPETLKNEVDLLKANFWGSLRPHFVFKFQDHNPQK